jgi:hypothetical protein
MAPCLRRYYYNNVEISEELLLRKTRGCGKIRADMGIPKSLADSSKKLKMGDALCRQKRDVLLHIWKDNKKVSMISTIYNGTIGQVINKFGKRIKKLTSVIQYKFMKGADRADQYLSCFTILKKPQNGARNLCFGQSSVHYSIPLACTSCRTPNQD